MDPESDSGEITANEQPAPQPNAAGAAAEVVSLREEIHSNRCQQPKQRTKRVDERCDRGNR